MMYAVEKMKPLPKPLSGGKCRYPWAKMEPGDSFLVPCTGDKRKAQRNLIGSARAWTKYHSKDAKYTTRQVVNGIRVWRVE